MRVPHLLMLLAECMLARNIDREAELALLKPHASYDDCLLAAAKLKEVGCEGWKLSYELHGWIAFAEANGLQIPEFRNDVAGLLEALRFGLRLRVDLMLRLLDQLLYCGYPDPCFNWVAEMCFTLQSTMWKLQWISYNISIHLGYLKRDLKREFIIFHFRNQANLEDADERNSSGDSGAGSLDDGEGRPNPDLGNREDNDGLQGADESNDGLRGGNEPNDGLQGADEPNDGLQGGDVPNDGQDIAQQEIAEPLGEQEDAATSNDEEDGAFWAPIWERLPFKNTGLFIKLDELIEQANSLRRLATGMLYQFSIKLAKNLYYKKDIREEFDVFAVGLAKMFPDVTVDDQGIERVAALVIRQFFDPHTYVFRGQLFTAPSSPFVRFFFDPHVMKRELLKLPDLFPTLKGNEEFIRFCNAFLGIVTRKLSKQFGTCLGYDHNYADIARLKGTFVLTSEECLGSTPALTMAKYKMLKWIVKGRVPSSYDLLSDFFTYLENPTNGDAKQTFKEKLNAFLQAVRGLYCLSPLTP